MTAVAGLALAALGLGFFALARFEAAGGDTAAGTFAAHVTTVTDGAAYDERLSTFREALEAWKRRPWLGVGIGGFGPFAAALPHLEPGAGWPIVNNIFLELLAETGLLGAAAFSFFILAVIKAGTVPLGTVPKGTLLAGLLAAFVGMLVQYQTFSTLYIMHFWFTVGLTLAASRWYSRTKNEL